ncbi:MAG: hypothetical protein ACTS7E_03515 [Arsenophonus sp. NC-CH8-MAG3]
MPKLKIETVVPNYIIVNLFETIILTTTTNREISDDKIFYHDIDHVIDVQNGEQD